MNRTGSLTGSAGSPTPVDHINSHGLLPLTYNEETVRHVIDRIKQIQDFMGRQMPLENLSSYAT